MDTDINKYASITALDISKDALRLYQSFNGKSSQTVHGSILDIPLEENSFDGIYNLGVLEHFALDEIQKILAEFKRVLKDSGRLVIFWPPEFGLSVLFFKALKKMVRVFTGKDVKFHPDEISRVESRESVTEIFNRSGFSVIEYSFGLRDLWTYSVIVGKKA